MIRGLESLSDSIRMFILEHRFYFQENKKKHKKYLSQLLIENTDESLPIRNVDDWLDKFNRLTYAYPDLIEVGEAFCQSHINIIQDRKVLQNDVLAICVEKNDLIKIKEFIKYHRSIGVDKFIILDNNSNDGSVEWLAKQEDVVLMQTKVPYTTNRREGWINRIMAYYGSSRWYLVADSDELLTYNQCESKNIHELIQYLEERKVSRARAMMLDMYATPDYYENGDLNDYIKRCVYFDKSTYYKKKGYFLDIVCGGPRERVFQQPPWLTKYPLFFLKEKDMECKSHFLFPFKGNKGSECNLILRHYKFQPGEIDKIQQIVKNGNYFNGSKQYKAYLKIMNNNKKLNFMCNDSEMYTSSESLRSINVYTPINWSERRGAGHEIE